MAYTKEEKAVRAIKLKEKYHYDRAAFCKEHNMELQQKFHWGVCEEIRKIASKVEDILDTGYISVYSDDE